MTHTTITLLDTTIVEETVELELLDYGTAGLAEWCQANERAVRQEGAPR